MILSSLMHTFVQDFKFGFRQLRQRPLLSVAISLSLALGIGANSAVFSIVDAILFRPMNVPNSDRLVSLYTSDYSGPQYGASSYADFADIRDKTNVFESLASFSEISAPLRYGEQSDRAFGLLVSGSYFDLLGVKAAHGRTLRAEDDQTGANPAVVISHNLWQRRFGADPSIVGKTVFLNSNGFTVAGITPESFTGTDLSRAPEIFVPIHMSGLIGFEPALTTNRTTRQFSIVGRLAPGVDAAGAQARLEMLSHQFSDAYPDDWKDRNKAPRRISVVSENYARVRPEVRSILTGLAGLFTVVVALVLLIACSNVSNILLARATARQKEMAVRTALGASRMRLIRQLLTESLQLSLLGSLFAILIAPLCISLIVATFVPPSDTPIPLDIGVNQQVILLTLGIGVVTGLIFGVVPALHASRTDLLLAMKDDSIGVRTRVRKLSFRNIFVITQVAVSLLLLIVAGLFIRSLEKAKGVELGYNINNVLTARPDAEFLESRDTTRQLAFYNEVLARVRLLPGVEGASFADMIPSGGGRRRTTIAVENYSPKAGENMSVLWSVVASDYFGTMGMALVSGREFTDHDNEGAQRVALINETMARQYWPGENPLGKKISLAGSRKGPLEVVGIVKDAVPYIYQTTPSAFFYLPMLQNPSPGMALHVRTKGDALEMLPAIRNQVDSLGEKVMLRDVKTLVDYMDESLLMLRFASILTGLFGAVALVLAIVGVFSVINYSTSRRTREIGIRLALGARRGDILKMVMKEGLFIVSVGVVVGLLMSFAGVRLIASFMFGNSETEVPIYVAFSLLLLGVALVACFIPAYKATRVDPTDALRYE
jgi:macrolide transport system ATP-binding/permease protein